MQTKTKKNFVAHKDYPRTANCHIKFLGYFRVCISSIHALFRTFNNVLQNPLVAWKPGCGSTDLGNAHYKNCGADCDRLSLYASLSAVNCTGNICVFIT